MQNTKTPTLISIISVVLNILFAFLLVNVLAVSNTFSTSLISALKLQGIADIRILALPLALTLSGMVQTVFLFLFLQTYVRETLQKDLYLSLLKTGLASVALVGVTYSILQIYGGVFPLTTYEEVLGQFLLASLGGMVIYIATAFFLKSPEILYFASYFKAFLTKRASSSKIR